MLYGAYTFLEQMGIGFYLGGDAFPGHDLPLEISASLAVEQKPVFAVRGSLPWYNFLNSPTTWDLDDFKYFFDQTSKMKNNFVGFHTYDSEPFAPYLDQGKPVYAAPLVTAKSYGWGGDKWMRFSDFYEGFDKTLPAHVIFAALDNINPASEPNVSAVYGMLSPQRERWPIPWYESDGGVWVQRVEFESATADWSIGWERPGR